MKTMLSLGMFGASLLLAGCGMSPLLNHHEAPGTDNSAPATELDILDTQPVVPAYDLKVVKLKVGMRWIKKQTDEDAGLFQLLFWRETGDAAKPYELTSPTQEIFVKLWMPDHGHGSTPVKVTAAVGTDGKTLPGIFDCSNVYFSMPGKWEIRVFLRVTGSGGTPVVVDQVFLPHQQ